MELDIKDLNKSYGDKEVLKDINFTFKNNKIYGLIGRNGAGKTTFFNSLNEDVEINSGTMTIDGERLNCNDIGYVLSTPIVPEFLTAKEFLTFFLETHKDTIKDIKDLDYYFDLVSIDKSDQDKLLKDYSHGMRNKMQLLINVISNTKIILLDEPLVSLDVLAQESIKKLLQDLKKDHIIIFSTHILEIALDICDDIVLLKDKHFEEIKKSNLGTKKYKDKILSALKEEKDA